jgi:hypothetical protein
LDIPKRNYVIKMRQSLISENSKNIIFEDGSLNFKYFNVKKGHYWSKEENEKLIQGVIRFGATDFKQIRKECFGKSNWSETEIRLRALGCTARPATGFWYARPPAEVSAHIDSVFATNHIEQEDRHE